jgi:hypothetical protein
VVPLPDGSLRLYTMHDKVEAFTSNDQAEAK